MHNDSARELSSAVVTTENRQISMDHKTTTDRTKTEAKTTKQIQEQQAPTMLIHQQQPATIRDNTNNTHIHILHIHIHTP